MSASIKTNDKGFTLPELAVSISVLAIISVSILTSITYYFASVNRNNMIIDMTTDAQNLLRNTSEEIRYGSGVRQTNALPDGNAPAGGWNTSNTSFVIIITMPATDADSNYIIDSSSGNPYNNEFVYFREGSALYRRKLANASAVGNTEKTTCPTASATTTCPADSKLIDYLNTIQFTLYDQDNAVTTNTTLARSVLVDLSQRRETFGNALRLDNSIRATLRNNFQ